MSSSAGHLCGINILVDERFFFHPPRQPGLVVQIAGILLFLAGGAWALYQASQATISAAFLIYLLPALVSVGVAPYLAYRAYALWGATYTLERDGISLHWGLRTVDIPMDTVLWLHLDSDLERPLPLPILRWPGSVVGMRHLPDGTLIECLASRSRRLILIGTPGKIYAISPDDMNGFLRVYQRFTELGSLTPLPPRSVYPTFLISRFWSDRLGRILLLGGLLLSLGLLAWVSLAVPTHSQVPLKLSPQGTALELVPAVRLLLLPVINGFFFLANLLLGLFFYRRSESHALAYLLWGSGVLTSLLFLSAVYFILKAA